MSFKDRVNPVSHWKLARFFIPLAIQAASQALSYPLVAMVASRGPGGPLNLAGLAQSTTVMFFLGMFAHLYIQVDEILLFHYATSNLSYFLFQV